MQEFINKLINVNEPKTIFTLCAIFIFSDVVTGYLKAFKFKEVNSSISRDRIYKESWMDDSFVIGIFYRCNY